jgi:predicted dehydrogenase
MSRTIRWGLIGCGDISEKRFAPALRDSKICDLVAVNRADYKKAEPFARRFGAKKAYRNWEELVADEEIEAVYVSTPVYLHAPMTVAAAEAGKHVLCEKPMALTVAECDQMIESCHANQVRLGIAYYRHFYPCIHRLKQILKSGEIGKPVSVHVRCFGFFNPEPDDPRFWFVRRELAGGGPWFDVGCHRLEVLIDLFGQVETIQGVAGNILFERDVEDTAATIFASAGSIHISDLNRGEMSILTTEGERLEQHPPNTNFHLPLIEDFAEAVIQKREPGVTGAIGRKVNQLLLSL